MEKIKILVDAHVFDHSFQGTSTYIKGLYNELVKDERFEITLCANKIENIKHHFGNERFKFVKLSSKSNIYRLLVEIPKIIKRNKFDYAHFQYIVPLIKTCKFINTIHDVLFLDFKSHFPLTYRLKNGFFFKLSASRSDIVLTVSEYSKNCINRHFGIERDKIFVTPNAVESIDISQLKDLREKYGLNNYILFVSRFEPRKNQRGLLQAYISLKLFEKDYQLVFVGSKNEKIEEEEYNQLITEIPDEIKKNVKFFESVPFEDLYSLYAFAKCFVYPSKAEGFGIPPIEAAILNCKVLCSNQAAMQDFDFFKYSFDPSDQKAFEENLSDILKDENYSYQEIKEKIVEKYNWTKISKELGLILISNFNNENSNNRHKGNS